MYEYDEKRDILFVSRVPVRKPDLVYKSSEMYKSYMKYIKTQFLEDIEEYVIKPINEKAARRGAKLGGVCWMNQAHCEVKYDTAASYTGNEYWSAFISLGSPRLLTEETPKFCAMRIPAMDRYGVVKREGHSLALIASLVQDDDITFDKSGLKVITEGGNFINLIQKGKEMKMEFRNKEYSAVQVLAALAQRDGEDVGTVLEFAKRMRFINTLNKEQTYNLYMEYSYDELKDTVLCSLTDQSYSLKKVRKRLNEALSIDRVEGKKLSQALLLGDGRKYEVGETITQNMVQAFKDNKVCAVPITDIPNLTGQYIADIILLGKVRRGTELVEPLSQYFPGNKGRYLMEDAESGPYIINEGTQITPGLLEALRYNGERSVVVRENMNSTTARRVFLEAIVLSNFSFEAGGGGKDYYVNTNGDIVDVQDDYLTVYDLLAMMSVFDQLCGGEEIQSIASRDLGLRKKVELAQEIFHKAMRKAGPEFVAKSRSKLLALFDPQDSRGINPVVLRDAEELEAIFYPLTVLWWRKVREMKVVQSVDFTNPLSYYSSLEKINTITRSKHSITEGMRSLSMGHYGRLCPYEIPSGAKMGVVNNRALFCKIEDGIMKTPYLRVRHIGNDSYLDREWVYMTVAEEEQYRIADLLSLKIEDVGGRMRIDSSERVLARIPAVKSLEKVTVFYVDVGHIDFVNVDPQQSLSLATSIIPFMGSDDSVRVTFEVSMSKQAKALQNAEVPYVMTSAYFDAVRKSPYFMIHAEHNGTVLDVTASQVVMQYDGIDEPVVYQYEMQEHTGQSVVVRSVEVKEGDTVEAGDILVSSNYTKDGLLALGRNAIVCYVPEGYNYEDGVYASKRMEHNLTSYNCVSEENHVSTIKKQVVVRPPNGFAYNMPGRDVYTIHYFGKNKHSMKERIKSKKLKGFVIDSGTVTDSFTHKVTATKAEAIDFNYVVSGDKTANRHGNKGVIPTLRPNSEMPRFRNGEFVDIVYNPAGVSSRMNIGQILECNLGLAGYVLQAKFNSDSFNGASLEDVKRMLKFAYRLANEDDAERVLADFPEFPEAWKRKRMEHIEWIRGWRGAFNEDGTAWMYNPRTGKMFEEPVLVGINYIHKLVQEAEAKLAARGGYLTSNYLQKGSSPVQGSSHGGGQKMGEMEIDALAAYGVSQYIQELMNARGDNPVARSNLTAQAIYGKGSPYDLPEDSAIRRSTEQFLYYMEALGVSITFTGDELPNITAFESDRRRVWSREGLIMNDLEEEDSAESFSDFESKI